MTAAFSPLHAHQCKAMPGGWHDKEPAFGVDILFACSLSSPSHMTHRLVMRSGRLGMLPQAPQNEKEMEDPRKPV